MEPRVWLPDDVAVSTGRRKSGDAASSADRHHAVQLFNRPARPWSALPEYSRRDGQREPSLHP